MVRSSSFVSGSVMCILQQGEDAVRVFLFTPGEEGQITSDFRPVVHNGDGRRYELPLRRGGGNRLGSLNEYSTDTALQLTGEWSVGIERLSVAAKRQRARDLTATSEVRTLPFPNLGEPYAFDLESTRGRLRSEDFSGRNALFHCWHTGCSPCIAEFAALKELAARFPDLLALVGVNFDDDAEKGVATAAEHGLTWPQVLVPPDDDVRECWQAVSTVRGFPRNFLVGPDGSLAGDITHLGANAERVIELLVTP